MLVAVRCRQSGQVCCERRKGEGGKEVRRGGEEDGRRGGEARGRGGEEERRRGGKEMRKREGRRGGG